MKYLDSGCRITQKWRITGRQFLDTYTTGANCHHTLQSRNYRLVLGANDVTARHSDCLCRQRTHGGLEYHCRRRLSARLASTSFHPHHSVVPSKSSTAVMLCAEWLTLLRRKLWDQGQIVVWLWCGCGCGVVVVRLQLELKNKNGAQSDCAPPSCREKRFVLVARPTAQIRCLNSRIVLQFVGWPMH